MSAQPQMAFTIRFLPLNFISCLLLLSVSAAAGSSNGDAWSSDPVSSDSWGSKVSHLVPNAAHLLKNGAKKLEHTVGHFDSDAAPCESNSSTNITTCVNGTMFNDRNRVPSIGNFAFCMYLFFTVAVYSCVFLLSVGAVQGGMMMGDGGDGESNACGDIGIGCRRLFLALLSGDWGKGRAMGGRRYSNLSFDDELSEESPSGNGSMRHARDLQFSNEPLTTVGRKF